MKINNTLILLGLITIQTACDQFVEIDPPRSELVRESVFKDAFTAEAAVVDLYVTLRNGFGGGDESGITGLAPLSSDEFDLFETDTDYQAVSENEIAPNNFMIESLWNNMYNTVYKANAIIEGLTASSIQLSSKDKFKGEALFIRAYTYFYLVNLWGDVPLITSTDYEVNTVKVRTPATAVYEQIVSDLLTAQSLLPKEYSGDRVRANQGAATSMLARVYLYLDEWEKAETEATKVIDNNLYELENDLNLVFRTSSDEAILQLWHSSYPREYVTFRISAALGGPLFASLKPEYLASFLPEDLRYMSWVTEVQVSGITYFGVYKYKSNARPPIDYSTLLRLAEQYLIRSEARAQQNDLVGATNDLDVVRIRAGLPGSSAGTKQALLEAIYLERKHELFAEQGHRWLDLKRIGKAAEALSSIKPSWSNEDLLYPIPESQIISNPGIVQNPQGL